MLADLSVCLSVQLQFFISELLVMLYTNPCVLYANLNANP